MNDEAIYDLLLDANNRIKYWSTISIKNPDNINATAEFYKAIGECTAYSRIQAMMWHEQKIESERAVAAKESAYQREVEELKKKRANKESD